MSTKALDLPLDIFKQDLLDKSVIASNGKNLYLRSEEEAFPSAKPVRQLADLEYSRSDALLHFIFNDGTQIDVPLVHLSSFGTGKPGKRGDKGRRGKDGKDGREGPKGASGCSGPPGVTGKTGLAGDKGSKGATGEKGPRGNRGPIGPKGLKGYRGIPNNDVDDPWANFVDPQSIGDKGRDGLDGEDGYHKIYVREAEPPKHIGAYPIWAHLYEYIPEPVFKKHYAPCCYEPEFSCEEQCPTTPCPTTTTTTSTTTTTTTTTPPLIEPLYGIAYVASASTSSSGACTAAISLKEALIDAQDDFSDSQNPVWDGLYTYTVIISAINNTSTDTYGKLNLEVLLGGTNVRFFDELSNLGTQVQLLRPGQKLVWGGSGDVTTTLFDHLIEFVATWTPDTGLDNIPLTVNGFITRKTVGSVQL